MQHSDSMVVSGALSGAAHSATPSSSTDIVPIFVDSWPGKSTSGRVLLVIHGLGEHGGRYRHLPEHLGGEFERVYAMDLRGHGRSGGLRGYAPRFDVFLDDIKRVVAEVQSREPGKRLYLLAHSFGGLIGLAYLLKERKVPFESAVISAPLLGVALRVPGYKKWLGEMLGRTFSKVQLTNEVNPSHLSHDPAVVEAYVKDRLVHGKITPKLYLEMTAAMDWVRAHAGPLACPALFLVPGDDRVVSSEATLEFYRNLKFRDKELREYPEFYHEPLNEVEKARVFDDIREWIARR